LLDDRVKCASQHAVSPVPNVIKRAKRAYSEKVVDSTSVQAVAKEGVLDLAVGEEGEQPAGCVVLCNC
jgi:hypothetical protein